MLCKYLGISLPTLSSPLWKLIFTRIPPGWGRGALTG
jgi:hypothetical protein